MADETLSWEMRLTDVMSGPIDQMDGRLGKFMADLDASKKKMAAFEAAVGSAASASRSAKFGSGPKTSAGTPFFGPSPRVPGQRPQTNFEKILYGKSEAASRFERMLAGDHASYGSRAPFGERFRTGRQSLASNLFGAGREARIEKRNKAIAKSIFGSDDEANVKAVQAGFSKIASVGTMAAGAIAGVAAAFGAAATAVVVSSGKWMVNQLVFKEDTLTTFETMLGSQKAAARVFKQATKFAAETPFSSEEVITGFRTFLTAGFKENDLDKLMRASGDVGAAMGSDSMKAFNVAISQIRANDKLLGGELMQLANAGVGKGAIKDALATTMGKSRKEVDALLSAGKISADAGIAAVLEAVRVSFSGGELGGGMGKKSKQLSGLFSSMMDIPSTLMQESESLGAVEPFKDLIKGILKSFDEGKPLFNKGVDMFNRISETWAKAFGGIKPEDIEATLGKAMDLFGDLMSNAGVFLGSFTERMVDNLGKMFGDDHDATARMEKMGKAVADLVTMILWAGEKAVWLIGKAQDIGLGTGWKLVGAAIDYLADADARASQVVGRVDSSHRASGKQKIPDDLFSRWYNNPDLLPVPSSIGMPKDAVSGALTSSSVTTSRVTTNIGDIKIIVPEGGDSDVPFLIADRVKRSLPNQIGNFALEQGG